MNVLAYRSDDDSVLARLFAETVRTINSADYSPEQVETWLGVSGPIFNDGRAFSNRLVFVLKMQLKSWALPCLIQTDTLSTCMCIIFIRDTELPLHYCDKSRRRQLHVA
jgi:hypothetical protein